MDRKPHRVIPAIAFTLASAIAVSGCSENNPGGTEIGGPTAHPVFTSIPPGALASKQAAQATEPRETLMPSTSVTYSWLPARSDDGGPGGVSAVNVVKAAALADLNRDMNDMALTCGTSCSSEPALTKQQLIDHLQPSLAVWASSVRAARQTEEVNALLQTQGDPTYVAYSAFRWDVSRWDGVTVRGNTATAVFEGKGDYLVAGKWHQDDTLQQAQLKLTLEDGAWKLLDQAGIYQ